MNETTMMFGKPSRVVGTLVLAGCCYEIHALPNGLAELLGHETSDRRLILTGPSGPPIVILRLGDLLQSFRVKGNQQGCPKTSSRVSVARTAGHARIRSRFHQASLSESRRSWSRSRGGVK